MVDEIYTYALRLLSKKDYLQSELKKKLVSRFGETENVERVIARLLTLGYLDDERFLGSFIRSKIKKGYGAYAIRQQLFEKGLEVNLEDIREKIKDDGYLNLKMLVREKYLKYKLDKEKTIAYFIRKGYSYSEIKSVLTEVIKDEGNIS